jgi:uncharacterized integral membrane protein
LNVLVALAVFLFFAVLLLVGLYNSGDVSVNLLLWQIGPAPMGAVIATAALYGMAFACAIGVLDGIKIRITNRRIRKQMRRLEEETDALRLKLARHEGLGAVPPGEDAQAPPDDRVWS